MRKGAGSGSEGTAIARKNAKGEKVRKEQMNKGEESQTDENDVARKGTALNINNYYNNWTSDICRVCKLLLPGRGFS